MWSLASLIFQSLVGVPPLKAGSPYLSFKKSLARDFCFPPGFPSVAADLVDKLLCMNPKERIGSEHCGGFAVLKAHPWFSGMDFDNINNSTRPLPNDLEMKAQEICEVLRATCVITLLLLITLLLCIRIIYLKVNHYLALCSKRLVT